MNSRGRDAGPGRERPFQPARYGFRAVPGMRTRLHGIHMTRRTRAILHGIAQVRSHGSIGGAPIPEQFAHPVAAVMVAGARRTPAGESGASASCSRL